MKAIFKNIYDHLSHLGLRLEDVETKLLAIPDFSGLTNAVKECQTK